MIERATRLLLLAQIAFVAMLTGIFVAIGGREHWFASWTAGIVILLFIRIAITINSFVLAWRYGSPTPKAMQLGMLASLRLFCGEFIATLYTSSIGMPFENFSYRRPSDANGTAVLLVHGYLCNGGYWSMLSERLMHAKIAHRALSLEPIFGDIDGYVDAIEVAINELSLDNKTKQVMVVVHSMGGLAVRAYMRRHGDSKIAKVITLGTPHHGTHMANSGLGMNCRQMSRDEASDGDGASEWLRELAKTEDNTRRAKFVSIFSHHDNIISPQTSSVYEGAQNIALHGVGHVALARSPLVLDLVMDELQKTPASTNDPSSKTALSDQ